MRVGIPLKYKIGQHGSVQLSSETVWRKILPHHSGTIYLLEIKIIQPLVVFVATGAGDTVRLMLVKTSLHGESFKGRTVFEEIAGRFLGYCGHVTL